MTRGTASSVPSLYDGNKWSRRLMSSLDEQTAAVTSTMAPAPIAPPPATPATASMLVMRYAGCPLGAITTKTTTELGTTHGNAVVTRTEAMTETELEAATKTGTETETTTEVRTPGSDEIRNENDVSAQAA